MLHLQPLQNMINLWWLASQHLSKAETCSLLCRWVAADWADRTSLEIDILEKLVLVLSLCSILTLAYTEKRGGFMRV